MLSFTIIVLLILDGTMIVISSVNGDRIGVAKLTPAAFGLYYMWAIFRN